MTPDIQPVRLHEAARRRYLSYALSVITSRALPDVRDGLKPVQRRILYAMRHNLHLGPETRHRKSAAVVGEVMARYHPHGDSSIYDAMVRMAQPFSLLHPMVDGQGNFGSLDGDPAAAMRYTEARLTALALELTEELKKQTVHYRPNYDGQQFEPVVLPARFPQLLINGTEGIAVGMATRIPPHNLREVIDASVMLIDKPDSTVRDLCRKVKGPDFPMGGQILADRKDLVQVYETGQGPVTVRGEYTTEKVSRRTYVVITSLPYGLNKANLVERIGMLVRDRRLPQVLDVRDESTDIIRVVLELRRPQDLHAAMAFVYKHTPLQQRYHLNLTCLIPTDNPEVSAPARLDLKQILRCWLDFRLETVRRRFEYDLNKLLERIHLLEGFEKIFDDLDEAIRLIRASEGKRDAAEKLMDRFDLDDVQAEAILETKLYKLAKIEIQSIREELAQKRTEAAKIEAILASEDALWGVVREELLEVRQKYGRARRTTFAEAEEAKIEISADDYIVAEDAYVIVTRDGWIKRQSSFTQMDKIRIREGDTIGWIHKASTRSTVTFFTDKGRACTLLVDVIGATTGYGSPIQQLFKFDAGEKVVGVISHDARNLPKVSEEPRLPLAEDAPPAGPYGVAISRDGRGLRFPLSQHNTPSTKSGRRYMRSTVGVLACYLTEGGEFASLATKDGHCLSFLVDELKVLGGPGKGVTAIKCAKDDRVLAFELHTKHHDGAKVLTTTGREETARYSKFSGKRGAKGRAVVRRGGFTTWIQHPVLHLGKGETGGRS
jgi:DNA gyrase subunit A